MVEDAKEAIGSMGDDTPLAVLVGHYRGLHHFFRQSFSQVTNPPIDSLREYRVMSLRTRLGSLKQRPRPEREPDAAPAARIPGAHQRRIRRVLRGYLGESAAVIDCTFRNDDDELALRRAMHRVQRQAEDAVRGGAVHLILSDRAVGPDRAAIPTILAVGGVHSHLVAQALRTFTSLNVECAECLDVHYFSVLIGVGATTVNAYLAEDTIADRHRRGLFGDMVRSRPASPATGRRSTRGC